MIIVNNDQLHGVVDYEVLRLCAQQLGHIQLFVTPWL